jgi:hypothetical protein
MSFSAPHGNVSGTPTFPTIGGCNQTAVTGGSGTFSGFTGASGHITITWATNGTTTAAYSSTAPKGNKCPIDSTVPGGTTKQTEIILHGSVQPPGNGGVKGALHTKLCLTSTFDLSLLAGQTFKI